MHQIRMRDLVVHAYLYLLSVGKHKLERVKFQNFTSALLEKLKNYIYIFTNADDLEIIEVPPECRL